MTELEIMERARMYVDKLANGIDPLTDLPVAEQDVVNQVRISRCLFYVSDVLRRVIENGGITPARHEKKAAFSMPPQGLGAVRFSQEPLGITILCQRISEAAGADEKLSSNIVLEWLESLGMLEKRSQADGKQARRPTQAGYQLGILEKERNGPNGNYLAVLYNEAAQHFIVDNLEAALAFRQAKNKT